MQVADRKEHVRNLQETCRKMASRKKAKPAKLSLIAISKFYCSNKFDVDLMRDRVFFAFLIPKNNTKKSHEASIKPRSKKSALNVPKHQTK